MVLFWRCHVVIIVIGNTPIDFRVGFVVFHWRIRLLLALHFLEEIKQKEIVHKIIFLSNITNTQKRFEISVNISFLKTVFELIVLSYLYIVTDSLFFNQIEQINVRIICKKRKEQSKNFVYYSFESKKSFNKAKLRLL